MYQDMRASQGFQCKDADLGKMEREYKRYLRHKMKRDCLVAWVAEIGGNIVGSGCVSVLAWPPGPGCSAEAVGLLHSMYTAPEYRKQGIAGRIIKALGKACKAKGCRSLILGGRGTNAGRHLYETLGFIPAENMRLDL
jgi:GNAT superfamily N-acetyltransferase